MQKIPSSGEPWAQGHDVRLMPARYVPVDAECHRQFWKPADLKLVLVAESHAYTDATDLRSTIARTRLPVATAQAPLEFVRPIYCLVLETSAAQDSRANLAEGAVAGAPRSKTPVVTGAF